MSRVTTSARRRLERTGVVLLNWRDEEATVECIASLSQIFEPQQIVVVDNESTGRLGRLAAGTGVSIIELPENRGFAAGVNVGLAELLERGVDYILALNTDTEVFADGLLPLFDDSAWPAGVGAAGPVILNSEGTVQSAGARFYPLTFRVRAHRVVRPAARIDFITWACALISSSTLRDIGLLDERFFMYWEDVEFGIRMRSAGLRIVVAQDARLTHAGSASHARAGDRIDAYSALGVVVLARVLGGAGIPGAAVRIGARLGRRLIRLRGRNARAVIEGARAGLCIVPPAYKSFGGT